MNQSVRRNFRRSRLQHDNLPKPTTPPAPSLAPRRLWGYKTAGLQATGLSRTKRDLQSLRYTSEFLQAV